MPPLASRGLLLVLLAAAACAAVYARGVHGIDWNANSVREVVARWGMWGPAVFVLLLALRSVLMIPSQVLLMAAGLCFGTAAGTLYGALGVTLSGGLVFGLTRWLGRETLRGRIPPRLQGRIDAVGRRTVAALAFAATAYPVGPLHAIHAGAALTSVAPPLFLLALAGGATVRAATYTYFGSSIAEGDVVQLALAGGLLAGIALLPLLVPSTRRWLLSLLQRPAQRTGNQGREGDASRDSTRTADDSRPMP